MVPCVFYKTVGHGTQDLLLLFAYKEPDQPRHCENHHLLLSSFGPKGCWHCVSLYWSGGTTGFGSALCISQACLSSMKLPKSGPVMLLMEFARRAVT